MKPLAMLVRKRNGVNLGTFIISIDDGFVEYEYHVFVGSTCIDDVYDAIRRTFHARKVKGKMRLPYRWL